MTDRSPQLVAAEALKALQAFHLDVAKWIETNGLRPTSHSLAQAELNKYPGLKCVENAYTQGTVMREVSADHLMLFFKSVAPPVQTVAPWSATRAMLESCAIGVWLLDHKLSVEDRIQRGFTLRYHGLQQQLKIANATKNAVGKQALLDRMTAVIDQASTLGIPPFIDKDGKTVGIGRPMPSITDLVETALGQGLHYRVLSMMAHAQMSALQQLGFRVIENDGMHYLDKHISPEAVYYLCDAAFVSLVKLLWNFANLFGLNALDLERMIESTADVMRIPIAERFWRTS